MKTSYNKPPHWFIMKAIFKCDWERTAFAFVDTIYSSSELPEHLIVHESVHLDQQGYSVIGAWIWLLRYLLSKKFRYRMELEAYRKQWKFFARQHRPSINEDFMRKIAGDLSGKLYGNIVTYQEAVRAIRSS